MDALKIYEDALDDLASDLITEDEFTEIIKCLRDVQEIKHGHWTNVQISQMGDSRAECNLCGTVVRNSFTQYYINYCPHCGAKMDEEVE